MIFSALLTCSWGSSATLALPQQEAEAGSPWSMQQVQASLRRGEGDRLICLGRGAPRCTDSVLLDSEESPSMLVYTGRKDKVLNFQFKESQ